MYRLEVYIDNNSKKGCKLIVFSFRPATHVSKFLMERRSNEKKIKRRRRRKKMFNEKFPCLILTTK